jgi:hypothetical protein
MGLFLFLGILVFELLICVFVVVLGGGCDLVSVKDCSFLGYLV